MTRQEITAAQQETIDEISTEGELDILVGNVPTGLRFVRHTGDSGGYFHLENLGLEHITTAVNDPRITGSYDNGGLGIGVRYSDHVDIIYHLTDPLACVSAAQLQRYCSEKGVKFNSQHQGDPASRDSTIALLETTARNIGGQTRK